MAADISIRLRFKGNIRFDTGSTPDRQPSFRASGRPFCQVGPAFILGYGPGFRSSTFFAAPASTASETPAQNASSGEKKSDSKSE